MIAGCGHTSGLPGSYFRDAYFVKDSVVYVYFSGGSGLEDRRYRRITEGTWHFRRSGLADLSVVGVDRDTLQFGRSLSNTWLYPHLRAVVVADADIGRFWDVVFGPTASPTTNSTGG